MSRIYLTKSVCPVCLRETTAEILDGDDGIYMDKSCPEHGSFHTRIWGDSKDNYLRWLRFGGVNVESLPQDDLELEHCLQGQSFCCEACTQPASVALMTTNRCNMNCPVCFTRDRREPLHEPGLEECEKLLRRYREDCGEDALLEFCGGEPTVRQDLCLLAELAREIGFDYIQLNTNGIRLAESADYCRSLREAGITTVYLGFDGVTDKPYFAKYGRNLLEIKKQAVNNCAQAGLAVVLVTCVIPKENDCELGEILRFAKANMPTVKGMYLQPISYFGIYPENNIRRITIPDVIRQLASQCDEIREEDFGPGAYEHAQCSFNACYIMDKNGRLRSLTRFSQRKPEEGAVHRVRRNLRGTWMPGPNKMLTVGGMAFQDGWNIDLLRVRRCSIQILQKDGKRISLCSKYLSGCNGIKVFPGIG